VKTPDLSREHCRFSFTSRKASLLLPILPDELRQRTIGSRWWASGTAEIGGLEFCWKIGKEVATIACGQAETCQLRR